MLNTNINLTVGKIKIHVEQERQSEGRGGGGTRNQAEERRGQELLLFDNGPRAKFRGEKGVYIEQMRSCFCGRCAGERNNGSIQTLS